MDKGSSRFLLIAKAVGNPEGLQSFTKMRSPAGIP